MSHRPLHQEHGSRSTFLHWMSAHRRTLVALLLFGLFRTAVADWNPIPSASMRPTLLEGDVVFVNRLAYDVKLPLTDLIVTHLAEPQRGDVVTFSSPRDGTRLIKRIVGLPGDTVAMRAKRLTINGVPASYQADALVSEPASPTELSARVQRQTEQLLNGSHPIQWFDRTSLADEFGPIRIPPDHYLMLGDNRDDSADSRYFGLVPRQLLIGHASRVLVSADILGNWAPRFERVGMRLSLRR